MTNQISDPYFQTDVCVERLLREWRKHPKLIIAVDFDDCVYPYHDQNFRYDTVINILKECSDLGFYIVIFSASSSDRYEFMRGYLEGRGVRVASINQNPIPLEFGNNGKIYYNILLDDRAGLFQAYEILRKTIDRIGEEKRFVDNNVSVRELTEQERHEVWNKKTV